jgi:predicted GNAT family acetyltransferase
MGYNNPKRKGFKMQIDLQVLKVIHNETEDQFEIHIEQLTGVSKYRLQGNIISFYHVEVPPEWEGQGIGGLLAKASLDYAREKSFKVIPACPFVAAYIRRHPEYQSLL